MFLSRLVLNPRSRQVQSELANPYEMHRTIMRAFPETLAPGERVLFRLELGPQAGHATLLVQSQGEPDWSYLDRRAPSYLLTITEPNPWVKHFEPCFRKGQRLLFRLRANPTVKRNGKRLGLYREDRQWAWLERKAGESGFQVLGARITKEEILRASLYREERRHELRLLTVQFDGLLEVSDPDLLLAAIRMGIGSGKGLGCGLLSVAPAA